MELGEHSWCTLICNDTQLTYIKKSTFSMPLFRLRGDLKPVLRNA